MIDKNSGSDFTVTLLHEWKNKHEKWMNENLNKRVQKETEVNQTFIVSSHNQVERITAGVVNMTPQQRKLNTTICNQLKQLLIDKNKTVTITYALGDGEAYSFATQIKDYLVGEGYDVHGVNQAVFSAPVFGQKFDPSTLTITIGTRQ